MQYQPKHYKWILRFIILLMALSIAAPVLADYLGPDRTVTTTVSVCKVVLKSCMYVESKGEYRYHVTDSWSCSNESKPWQAYPSNGGACPLGKDHWERDESVQEITVTYDPATISGSLQNCTVQNGWCVTSPTISLSANEPLAGYSITLIEGTLNGGMFACPNGATSCTVPFNEGEKKYTINFQHKHLEENRPIVHVRYKIMDVFYRVSDV